MLRPTYLYRLGPENFIASPEVRILHMNRQLSRYSHRDLKDGSQHQERQACPRVVICDGSRRIYKGSVPSAVGAEKQ